MKKILFLITLFRFLIINPLYSQTYDPADSSALISIKVHCDWSGNLNWSREANPGKWTGVTWDNTIPKRVSKLVLSNSYLQSAVETISYLFHHYQK